MGRTMQVSDSVMIKADALKIWEQVADPTQMPRWSPENTGARTRADEPSAGEPTLGSDRPMVPLRVGEVFESTNRRARARWVTECVVTASEPGRTFAFKVRKIGASAPKLKGGIATWTYEFEDSEGGTRVTESWKDDRTTWPDWVAAIVDRVVTGGRSFADFQRMNIHRTLTTMKEALE